MHAHTLWDTQQLQQVLPTLAVCPGPAEFDANAVPAMSCPLLSSQLVLVPPW